MTVGGGDLEGQAARRSFRTGTVALPHFPREMMDMIRLLLDTKSYLGRNKRRARCLFKPFQAERPVQEKLRGALTRLDQLPDKAARPRSFDARPRPPLRLLCYAPERSRSRVSLRRSLTCSNRLFLYAIFSSLVYFRCPFGFRGGNKTKRGMSE